MKLNTGVILVKGFCFVVIGAFTPLGTSLAQYANTGEWPSKIVWWGVVIPACAIGAASQLLSFLSGSFSKYSEERKASSDTQFLANPAPPKPQQTQ